MSKHATNIRHVAEKISNNFALESIVLQHAAEEIDRLTAEVGRLTVKKVERPTEEGWYWCRWSSNYEWKMMFYLKDAYFKPGMEYFGPIPQPQPESGAPNE